MRTYPLLQTQLGVFLECIQYPEATQYNLPWYMKLESSVDIDRLGKAWETIVRQKAALRTRFAMDENGEPMQWCDDAMKIPVQYHKCQEADWERFAQEELITPFDVLSGEPLARCYIVTTEQSTYLLLSLCQLIMDGHSYAMLLKEELNKAYLGQPVAEDRGLYEAALKEAEAMSGPVYAAAKAFFQERFADNDFTTLSPKAAGSLGKQIVSSSYVDIQQCDDWCQKHNVSVNILFQSAFVYCLSAISRQGTVSYGMQYHNRNDELRANSMGMFVNTVPVLVDIPMNITVRELFTLVRQSQKQSLTHGMYPINCFAHDTGKYHRINYNFRAGRAVSLYLQIDQCRMGCKRFTAALTPDDMSVAIDRAEKAYVVRVDSSAAMNDKAVLSMVAESVKNCVYNIMAKLEENPAVKLADISLLSDEQAKEIISLSRGEELSYDENTTWLSLFAKCVKLQPEKLAIVDKNSSYTYAELETASNKIAHYLVGNGVAVNDFVAVKLGRIKEYAAAVVGIQKAGAAFVPVDMEYPADRIAYIIENSHAKYILDEAKLKEIISSDISSEAIDNAKPANRAYMIYTSGSTGKPKGVILHQRGLMNFTKGIIAMFELTNADRISAHRSFSFDAHIGDFYPTLAAGATVYIMPEDVRRDLDKIYNFLINNEITGGGYTTSIAKLLLTNYDLKQRFISCGGEALQNITCGEVQIFNEYGPTECNDDVTVCKLEKGRYYEAVPIGRPMINSYCFIVDKYNHLVPQGVEGEICYAGPQVGYGYCNLPDKTVEVFEDCPFVAGLRMYHTGDVGYYNAEGNIEYTGRSDFQIKLNGYRIELGEIEGKALQYKTIRQVSAQVRNSQICLYYTAAGNVDENELKVFLSESLAAYMVPTAYMQLDKMPLTPNGKVDRKALPDLKVQLEEIIAPSTELEEKVLAIVAEHLNRSEFGVTNNLVSLGMSSLAAMRLSATINRKLNYHVRVADIMKAPTVREITALLKNAEKAQQETIKHIMDKEYYPITENQRGVYIDWEMNRGTTQYNIPSVHKFANKNATKLAEAVRTVIDYHSVLKTRFAIINEDVMQQPHNDEAADVLVVNLPEEAKVPTAEFFQSRIKPFDLLNDKLYRAEIYAFGNDTYLFLDIHHMLYDGLSSQVFMNDVLAVYEGKKLTAEAITAYDFAVYEHELVESEEFAKAESYYDTLVGDAVAVSYPDSKQPDGIKTGSCEVRVAAKPLEAVSAKNGITVSSFFNAVLAETLQRITREVNPMYLTISNGREADSRLANCVGMFVKTLPVVLRTEKHGKENVAEFVKDFHNQLQDTIANDFYPYTNIVEKHGLKGEIMFVYQGGLLEGGNIDGVETIPMSLDTGKFPIMVKAYPSAGCYVISIEYDGMKYAGADMKLFAKAIANVAVNMATSENMSDVGIISETEKAEIMAMSTGPRLDFNTNETWLNMFERWVEVQPEHLAVADRAGQMTYAELDKASDKLASYLMAHGVQPNDFIVIKLHRVKEFAIAVIGIQKAGACYIPIDPNYPEERINFMETDSGAKLVLNEALMAEILKNTVASGHTNIATPENLAYTIYTSGSTGRPKGAMLSHRALMNYVQVYTRRFEITPEDRISHHITFSFDSHIRDFYPALAGGASLHFMPDEICKEPDEIYKFLEDNKITGSAYATAMGQLLLNSYELHQRFISVGGEALLGIKADTIRVFNVCGATECTDVVVDHELIRGKYYDSVPIGKPLPNCYAFILDKYNHLLPQGVAGEICYAGPHIGEGYWNLPDKTAASFVDCPFVPGERMYHTGDLGRYNADGEVEYLGRIDFQVKLRGFRVELGEVESRAIQFTGMKQVVAAVKQDNLVLYYTAEAGINEAELKSFMGETLTEYMVPSVFIMLVKMPMTPSGKIDRKLLPEPEINIENIVAPETELEKQIFAVTAELLGTENFGVTTNLISLGMSSIKAMKLSIQIFKKYKLAIKSSDIIGHPTIRELAKIATTAASSENKAITAKRQLLSLGNAQKGVYVDCISEPDTVRYNMPFCITVPEAYTAAQVQKAVMAVIGAHYNFKLNFVASDSGDILQELKDDYSYDIPVLSMSHSEFTGYRNSFVKPFKLGKEKLARFVIVESDKLYLLMDMHHLMCDGSSLNIFLNQFAAALDGEIPEAEEYTYFDYIKDEVIEQATEDFYAQRMQSVEESTQLIPDVYDGNDSHALGHVMVATDLAEVNNFATAIGVTPANIYLAATLITAGRFVAEDQVSLVTISNGRSNLNIYNTMGMFVNTLPIVEKIDTREKAVSFIKRVANNFNATIQHENYPFALIAKKYDFRPNLSFAYQVGVMEAYDTKGGKLELEGLDLGVAKAPLSVSINERPQYGGTINLEYDKGMYSHDMMENVAKSIRNVAAQLIHVKTVGEIGLTDADMCQVLDSYNRSLDLGYDLHDTVVSKFRRTAAQYPDKLAGVYKDKSYTYKELDELTDRMASVLYSKITAVTGKDNLAETVVSILINRNENVFILPLAVMKTGCAYEPLDPSYPKERLNFMVKDAKSVLLLAESALADMVDEFTGEILPVEALYKQTEALYHGLEATHFPPAAELHPENLMIMLYTSGSTGVPKGVQIQHSNMVAYAYGINQDGFYTDDGKTAAYASFGFDVCMSDTFCTFLNGATLYIIPEDMRMELDKLAAYFDEVGITQIVMTTQVGVQFLQNYPQLKTLRYLTMGGEKLPAVDPSKLNYQINNGYGPTENCCGVSIFPIRHWESNIPIGKPFPTINGYVLDKTGHRLPAGAAGEYCVAGPQVSRGYLNRPEKTAEAYGPCPFIPYPMYHTGDIVRYRASGDVEFVGRKDGQVKIRGFRVETKEVEAVIRSYSEILDVTVQAFSFASGGKYLAAYVVGKNSINISSLQEYIRSQKPSYMVPSVIMQIEAIPLTVNQKVDKKALPKPEMQQKSYAAPKNKTEEDFCHIFETVSGRERVGATDDFFEIGGSSILAMKVVIAASKLGYKIVYKDVFAHTTPRELASYMLSGDNQKAEPEQRLENRQKPDGENGIIEIGPDGYDYHAINALLRGNTIDAFRNGEAQPINDVLLAGATGYLGIHVLRDLLDNSHGKIYCIIRSKGKIKAEDRLKTLLFYYFENDYAEAFGKRLIIIEGDVTDKEVFAGLHLAEKKITVINCAACVKHFARGNLIERVNVDSVRNLIDWCLRENARLVHVSTGSVAGSTDGKTLPQGFKFDEHVLYAGQIVDSNQYVHSKFIAERLIYEAVLRDGLNAKVLRAGNLAPNNKDGEFQINARTNSFMGNLRAFSVLGMISYDAMDSHIEFSPIDCTARAMLLLATTPKECVCFMASNQHRILWGDVVMGLENIGIKMRMVEPEELKYNIEQAMLDPVKSDAMRPLLAYNSNDSSIKGLGYDDIDVHYTAQVLYRLGFRWPEVSQNYVKRFMTAMNGLGFFDL